MDLSAWPLVVNIGIFVAAATVVWFSGSRLAGAVDSIAEITGIGRAALGMILLGGVTALPELSVAVTSTLQQTPLLSVNNLLGSVSANLVILALADAFIVRGALTSMLPSSSVLLQGVLGITLLSVAAGATFVAGWAFLGLGAWTWLLVGIYAGSIWLVTRTRSADAWSPSAPGGPERKTETRESAPSSLKRELRRTVIAALGILVAGYLLATTGDEISARTQLGTSFFGAVFLSLATSLPEVSTVFGAVRLRRYEMAISDVLGANIFNVAAIAVVDALHRGGPIMELAGRQAGFVALLGLACTAIFLVGMLERRDRTILRMGYDSALVISTYIAGLLVLFELR